MKEVKKIFFDVICKIIQNQGFWATTASFSDFIKIQKKDLEKSLK